MTTIDPAVPDSNESSEVACARLCVEQVWEAAKYPTNQNIDAAISSLARLGLQTKSLNGKQYSSTASRYLKAALKLKSVDAKRQKIEEAKDLVSRLPSACLHP